MSFTAKNELGKRFVKDKAHRAFVMVGFGERWLALSDPQEPFDILK
jgi:hypothetical protein